MESVGWVLEICWLFYGSIDAEWTNHPTIC